MGCMHAFKSIGKNKRKMHLQRVQKVSSLSFIAWNEYYFIRKYVITELLCFSKINTY